MLYAARVKTLVLCIILALCGTTLCRGDEAEIVNGALGKRLDEYLSRITPFGFSGALLVAQHGRVVLNKGYGLADRTEGIRNTSETIFCAGSITKQFTAAAIMTLEMQGKLKTEDPLGKYLDGVPPDKSDITLHNLLTHTSGLVPDVGRDYDIAERDLTVKKILALPLEFASGERFEYSNVNYTLLAALIEKLSGQTYEQYLHEHLFKPAGMLWTGYRMPLWTERIVAHWYVGDQDNTNSLQRPFPYWNLIGNGGILTTTDDMYKWHLALNGEKILSGDAKKKLFTPFLNDYAYGWDVLETVHGKVVQHNGGSDLGNNAEIRRYIDSNTVTILFCNQFYEGKPLIDAVRKKIEDIVFGGKVSLPAQIAGTPRGTLKKFSGEYKLPSGEAFLVAAAHDGLLVTPEGQGAVSLLAFPEGSDAQLLKKLGATSVKVLQAAVRGDFGPLGGVMENRKKRMEGVRGLIEGRIREEKERIGEIRSVAAISTLPSPFDDGAVETCMELKGDRGSFYLRLIWQGERNVGIGPMEGARRVEFRFLPVSSTEFAGYDLILGKDVRISFNTDGAGAVLTVHGKGKSVKARKASR